MKISELEVILKDIKEKHGDISVVHRENHEYWGNVDSNLEFNYNLIISTHAQPEGPKSGKSETALVFSSIG